MLKSQVLVDEITKELSNAFDYQFNGETTFDPPQFELPQDFSIGLIVGPSGSGKSTILRSLGSPSKLEWKRDAAVCSHFANAEEAREKLGAVGLNSVPSWMRPFHVLSNGEQFRAELARRLVDGALVDEFTSVVDRHVAKSCAFAIQRYIREKSIKGLVFATCHYDIIEWLQPDWTFDTSTGKLAGRGSERRPEIVIELSPATAEAWPYFRHHHYLSGDINKAARCWVAYWDDVPVGFAAALAFPNGYIKNAWREHRVVTLPEFQGMGIGVRISDAIGEMVLADGGRYFSKTANHRMGRYRNESRQWKATSKNMRSRADYNHNRHTKESAYKDRHIHRVCYSHEYVGASYPRRDDKSSPLSEA